MRNKKSLGMLDGDDDGKSGNKYMKRTPKRKIFLTDDRVNQNISSSQTPVKQRQATPQTTNGKMAVNEFQGVKGKISKQNKNDKMSDDNDDDEEEEEGDDDDDLDDDFDLELGTEEDDSDFEDDDIDDDDDDDDFDEDDDDDDEDDDEEEDDEDIATENKNRTVSKVCIKEEIKQGDDKSAQKSANNRTNKQGNELRKKKLSKTSQKKIALKKMSRKDDDEEDNNEDDENENEDEDEVEETQMDMKVESSDIGGKMEKQDSHVKTKEAVNTSTLFFNNQSEKAESPQKKVLPRAASESTEKTPDKCKLYMAKFPLDVERDEIKSLSPDIIHVFLPDSRRYSLLTFASEEIARKNLSALEKQTLRGQPIFVDLKGHKSKHLTTPNKSEHVIETSVQNSSALRAEGKCLPSENKYEDMKGTNVRNITVFGVPPEVTIDQIASVFPKASAIVFATVKKFRNAYIAFENASDAENAINNNKTVKISGHEMRVVFAGRRKDGGKRKNPGQNKFPFGKNKKMKK